MSKSSHFLSLEGFDPRLKFAARDALLHYYFAMCYSSLVEKDFEKLGSRLDAYPWDDAFHEFRSLQQLEQSLDSDQIKQILGMKQRPRSSQFKWLDDDGRLYPKVFAPVIVSSGGERRVEPMRFRVRPAGSRQEVPGQFNVYNAKIESLSSSPTGRLLIGQQHALLPVKRIYEIVNKTEIGIEPADTDLLYIPLIYDQWTSIDNRMSFKSFAIITRPAPPDIIALGHARSPVILGLHQIDGWLNANDVPQSLEILAEGQVGSFRKVA